MVGHNRVFGYCIQVTKANLQMVPEAYIRKQTLVNAERFVTPDLRHKENRITSAKERLMALEHDYCRPVVDDGDRIELVACRHPVVEQLLR